MCVQVCMYKYQYTYWMSVLKLQWTLEENFLRGILWRLDYEESTYDQDYQNLMSPDSEQASL